MKDHKLKCWTEFFEDIAQDIKNFEYRKKDRDFEIGDTLYLQEYQPYKKEYTGRNLRVLVTGLWDSLPGLPDDYCIMQIKLLQYWKTNVEY